MSEAFETIKKVINGITNDEVQDVVRLLKARRSIEAQRRTLTLFAGTKATYTGRNDPKFGLFVGQDVDVIKVNRTTCTIKSKVGRIVRCPSSMLAPKD